jgi:hypothetical protein
MKMRDKFKLLFFIAIILTVLVFNSCKKEINNHEELAQKKEAAEIHYTSKVNWIGHWLGEDKREDLVREVGNEFEFRNQDIQVNLKFPQELMGSKSLDLEADYIIKLISSPNPGYDIVWLDNAIYQVVAHKLGDSNWGKKYLVDFTEYPEFVNSHKDFIVQDPQYRRQMGGILAGTYLEGYYYSIWYNKEVAKEIGITVKDFDMTYDDLLQYVKATYEYNKKSSKHIAAIYEASDWLTTPILFQNLYKSALDGNNPSQAEQRSALKKTLQAFEVIGQFEPLISTFRSNKWFETRNKPLENECLFYIQGTWMYSHWRGIDKEKIKKMVPAELPVFKPQDHYLGGYISAFAVLKNSPNIDNAIKLMLYWCRPDVAEKWVRYTKNPTGLKGNITSSEIGSDVFEKFQNTIVTKYGSRVGYVSDGSYINEGATPAYTSNLNATIIRVLNGEISAEKAYNLIK